LEGEIWAGEARLNALMDIAPEAIVLANGRSGRILKANHQASVIFGYTLRELVGLPVEALVPSDLHDIHVKYRQGFLHNVRKREMGYHPPIQAVRKDGSLVELDIALTATAATDDVMVVCRLRKSG
jgi:PAS domain S-box-containing protein